MALKTFTTTIGFYDLAIAAPSMKAALDAWGAKQNLFHQGLAAQTDDPDIIEAAMAKPGVVLRRAVGTSNPFAEHAAPPRSLAGKAPQQKALPSKKPKPKRAAAANENPQSQKAAVIEFAKEKARRDREREQQAVAQAREDAAQARDDERRRKSIDKAQAVLDRAQAQHAAKLEQLEKERQAAQDAVDAEKERWERALKALQEQVRKAGR